MLPAEHWDFMIGDVVKINLLITKRVFESRLCNLADREGNSFQFLDRITRASWVS